MKTAVSLMKSSEDIVASRTSPLGDGFAFRCPGESQTVPRSLHLARLASGFPACQSCDFRVDTGGLPPHVIRQLRIAESTVEELIQPEGIRGRYLNQISRASVASITGHVLNLVDELSTKPGAQMRVLCGMDSRPSSPELSLGLVQAVRQSGCDVLDAGMVSRPQFDFLSKTVHPDLGIYLTGGAHPETVNGLDLFDHNGMPWSDPGLLANLRTRLDRLPARRSRRSGEYRPIGFQDDYERWLQEEFHALRPLRIALGCPDPHWGELAERMLIETPCTSHLTQTDDPIRVRETIRQRHADLGFLIQRDGRTCQIFDETGEPIGMEKWVRLLIQGLNRTESVAVPSERSLNAMLQINGTESECLKTLVSERVPFVADSRGRIWFASNGGHCDALLAIARTLQSISLTSQRVSAWSD